MGSISKTRLRVGRDRLSQLPDSLITHILSFLDTKEAVRTSLLSTGWKKQWTRVPNLEFGPQDYPIGVDRTLSLRDSSSNIRKFVLFLIEGQEQVLDVVRIDDWIRNVIRHNVVELHLWVDFKYLKQIMRLPQSLFTSETLKVLRLRSYFIINPPTLGCFPSLKVLEVRVPVSGCNISMLEKLFSNCPVLEGLTIQAGFPLSRGCGINISAPELKMLKIILSGEGPYFQRNEEFHGYNFYINAPKLVNFDLVMDHLSAYRFQVNLNAHFKAKLRLDPDKKKFVSGIAILDTISTVKHLSLSSSCVFKVLPDFVNLTHLELEAPFLSNGWALLVGFLKRSPSLEYLSIKPGHETSLGSYQRLSGSLIRGTFSNWCYAPEVVPDCMLTHLKTIRFENFTGTQDEMRMAAYLLKNSQVLKKMTVFINGNFNADEKAIYSEFLMFERGSVTSKVEILNMP